MQDNPPAPAIACAESISLLHLLHSVPTLPSSNAIDCLLVHRKDYTLSLEKELSLANTLAFLSNVKDDPNHISAVCIEERPKSASLSVLLAVNRVKRDDGNQFLQTLKQDFETIFAILSQLRDGEW